ncbi:MAG TPA: hypothetical protein VNT79_15600 [Phycisphaerae bacterium]|nr:hypothetical protein [Phycisphaerae bacterium]
MPDRPRLSSMLRGFRATRFHAALRDRLPSVIAFLSGVVVFVGIALWRYEPRKIVTSMPDLTRVERAVDGSADWLDSGDFPASQPVDFETALVESIHDRGYISVTAHVALYQESRSKKRRFADGKSAVDNMYWGALFGIDTHLGNAAGWRRAFQDQGGGSGAIRRSVFHKRVEPNEAWQARTVEQPFDVYVLAVAWQHSAVKEAMGQPLREALCGERTVLEIDGQSVEFGAGSALTGYIGQNAMLVEYWDAFAPLAFCPRPVRQLGVFYVAPRSALLLHRQTMEHGLYPVLFARESITPEAYLLDGMLNGLISGELGDGFVTRAAEEYVKYQKSYTKTQVMVMLMR